MCHLNDGFQKKGYESFFWFVDYSLISGNHSKKWNPARFHGWGRCVGDRARLGTLLWHHKITFHLFILQFVCVSLYDWALHCFVPLICLESWHYKHCLTHSTVLLTGQWCWCVIVALTGYREERPLECFIFLTLTCGNVYQTSLRSLCKHWRCVSRMQLCYSPSSVCLKFWFASTEGYTLCLFYYSCVPSINS